MNLLNFQQNNSINSFLDCIFENGLIPTISLPTRFDLNNRSATLIDNILVKTRKEDKRILPGILFSKISDHLPCFISRPNCKINRNIPKYITVTKSTPERWSCFLNDLDQVEWSNIIDTNIEVNPNITYDTLLDLVKKIKDKNLPTKRLKLDKRKHKVSPWITAGVIKSINTKNQLYKKLKKCDVNTISFNLYSNILNRFKQYERILKKTISILKKDYYFKILFKINPKWQI